MTADRRLQTSGPLAQTSAPCPDDQFSDRTCVRVRGAQFSDRTWRRCPGAPLSVSERVGIRGAHFSDRTKGGAVFETPNVRTSWCPRHQVPVPGTSELRHKKLRDWCWQLTTNPGHRSVKLRNSCGFCHILGYKSIILATSQHNRGQGPEKPPKVCTEFGTGKQKGHTRWLLKETPIKKANNH